MLCSNLILHTLSRRLRHMATMLEDSPIARNAMLNVQLGHLQNYSLCGACNSDGKIKLIQ